MSQRDRILRLLQEREGRWVPLYEILPLAAQYDARILELRRQLEPRGYVIESRVVHSNGRVRSCFRLLPPQPAQGELFAGLCGTGGGREIPESWSL